MKMIEIVERLKAEFPNETVFFTMMVAYFGDPECSDSLIAEIYMSSHSVGNCIKCASLEDGIAQIKRQLAGFKEAKNADIEDATRVDGVTP